MQDVSENTYGDHYVAVPTAAKYARFTVIKSKKSDFYIKGVLPINVEITEINNALTDIQTELDQKQYKPLYYTDRIFNVIPYSVISDDDSDAPINTAEHYIYVAKQKVFTSIKGDVRPTSDGGLVMCHDPGFTLGTQSGRITTYDASSENTIVIHDTPKATLLQLQYFKAYQGSYCNVCDADTYFRVCKKYGKTAFVTVRGEYIDEVIAALFPIIDKYNMRKHTIINSLTWESIVAVREADPSIMCNFVLASNSAITTGAVDDVAALGNCILSGFHFPNGDGLSGLDDCATAIAYAHSKGVRLYEAIIYTDADTTLDGLMQRGIAGAQFATTPTIWE